LSKTDHGADKSVWDGTLVVFETSRRGQTGSDTVLRGRVMSSRCRQVLHVCGRCNN
jgi:hypothetical protein